MKWKTLTPKSTIFDGWNHHQQRISLSILESNKSFSLFSQKKWKTSEIKFRTKNQCFKTRPGPAGRPGSEAGPGLSQKQAGTWPGRPGGSTRDPADPAKPGWDPGIFFFYILMPETTTTKGRMHCNLQSTELQKWEEDLINFKKLSNPFHSQSRRRVDEQKTLESLIAVSILSIRLDEFLLVSFFFRLSLSSVSSSSLCWTCRRV